MFFLSLFLRLFFLLSYLSSIYFFLSLSFLFIFPIFTFQFFYPFLDIGSLFLFFILFFVSPYFLSIFSDYQKLSYLFFLHLHLLPPSSHLFPSCISSCKGICRMRVGSWGMEMRLGENEGTRKEGKVCSGSRRRRGIVWDAKTGWLSFDIQSGGWNSRVRSGDSNGAEVVGVDGRKLEVWVEI